MTIESLPKVRTRGISNPLPHYYHLHADLPKAIIHLPNALQLTHQDKLHIDHHSLHTNLVLGWSWSILAKTNLRGNREHATLHDLRRTIHTTRYTRSSLPSKSADEMLQKALEKRSAIIQFRCHFSTRSAHFLGFAIRETQNSFDKPARSRPWLALRAGDWTGGT